MRLSESQIKWIMTIAGVLTCTMVYAAIAPQAALRATFGEALEGPLAEIVVRNWGVLITLMGGLLVYGAFTPAARLVALVVAGLSKVAFIGLVLGFGTRFLSQQAGIVIAIDGLWVALFVWYLFGRRAAPFAG